MGNKDNPRRKGEGGLYLRPKRVWNEVKNDYELVDYYQAVSEVKDRNDQERRIRITGTARTAEEAKQRLQENIAKHFKKKGLTEAGIVPQKLEPGEKGVTVEQYLESYIAALDPEKVSVTMRNKYRSTFRNHVIPHIGHIHLKELTHEPLEYLFKTTLKEKKKIKEGVTTDIPLLGQNARLNIYKQLRSALIRAQDLQLIPVNYLKLVTAPTYEAPVENIPHMMNVVLAMFRKMDELKDPARNHFMLALLGLRRGERLGLAFTDLKLNTDRPTMKIRHQLKRVTGQGLHISNATKTGKSRIVAIPEPFLTVLKERQQHRKVQKKMPGFKPSPEFANLVFLHDNGKPFDLNEDNDWWNEINKKYNPYTKHIRGHALRHIAATYMVDENIDADIVRAVLGHESEAMGYYYMRISANKQRSQLDLMGESLTARITSTK